MINWDDIEKAQAELNKMREEYFAQLRVDNPLQFGAWSGSKDRSAIADEHSRIVNLHRQRIIDAVVSAGGTVTIDGAGEVKVHLPYDPKQYAEYEAALKEKEDEHEDLHRYVDVLENALCEDGVKIHRNYNGTAGQYTCRVELPKREPIAPVADIDAAAREYAKQVVIRYTYIKGATVSIGMRLGGQTTAVAVPFAEDGEDLVWVRNSIAECLADFYRQQTEGK